MQTEPTRLVSLINAALAATVGILAVTGVLSVEVTGAIVLALGAWVAVVGEFLRSKVTPVEAPTLTPAQYANVNIEP